MLSHKIEKQKFKRNFFSNLLRFLRHFLCVLWVFCVLQKIADCMRNFYVEVVPYQRDTKNGGERYKTLGNVNFLHVVSITGGNI